MKNRIEALRKEKGYTQQALGEALGVSRQTIISLENGKYNPSILLAHKISAVFKKKIEDVFIFDDEDL